MGVRDVEDRSVGGGDEVHANSGAVREEPSDGPDEVEAQQRCLAMYGRLSGHERRPVTADRVSQAMNKEISHYTVGLSNAFFVDAGWLEKRGKGEYASSDALVDYLRRLGINKEDVARAVQPLRSTVLSTWFWQAIKSQLDFSNQADEGELLHVLMSEAEASSEHLPQLRNLLEWVEYVGLIRRSDGLVRLVNAHEPNGNVEERLSAAPADEYPSEEPPVNEMDRPADTEVPKPTNVRMASAPQAPQAPTQMPALLSFDFSVRVTAEDLAKLDTQQIQALFAAVGTVMSSKAGTQSLVTGGPFKGELPHRSSGAKGFTAGFWTRPVRGSTPRRSTADPSGSTVAA